MNARDSACAKALDNGAGCVYPDSKSGPNQWRVKSAIFEYIFYKQDQHLSESAASGVAPRGNFEHTR